MSERRLVSGLKFEFRQDAGEHPTLVGLAVPYGKWSKPIYGAFRETIEAGAFDEHLAKSPDVIATVNHDSQKLLGRTASNTLKLFAGADGIRVEVTLPDVSYARDLRELVSRGDISGMSFVFRSLEDVWDRNQAGESIRKVLKAEINEVAFVTDPAYPDTEVSVRHTGGSDTEREALIGMAGRVGRSAAVNRKLVALLDRR